jgi:hypothetical protein
VHHRVEQTAHPPEYAYIKPQVAPPSANLGSLHATETIGRIVATSGEYGTVPEYEPKVASTMIDAELIPQEERRVSVNPLRHSRAGI